MDALRLIVLLLLCGSGCGGGEGSSSSPRPAEQVLIENNVGLAYYGIQHPAWPCAESLAAMAGQAAPKISFVWNAFGTETACLEAFLSDPRPKVLEVHLFDEVCFRKGTCQPYDFGGHLSRGQFAAAVRGGDGAFFAALKKYAAPVAAFLRGREGLTCLISPGLESNLPAELGARVIEFVRPLFPQCEMVWNGGGRIAGTIYESHVMRNTWRRQCATLSVSCNT